MSVYYYIITSLRFTHPPLTDADGRCVVGLMGRSELTFVGCNLVSEGIALSHSEGTHFLAA